MTSRNPLRGLARWLRGPRCRPAPGRRPLELEALEDRVLLTVSAAFDWRMQDRFGLDENNNGRIDLNLNHYYANPGAFNTTFTASSPGGVSYTWTINSPSLVGPKYYSGQTVIAALAEGTYYVNLTVRDAAGHTASQTTPVTVKDLLVVSIGDSYASGEGNPEKGNTFVDTYLFGKYQDDDPLWGDDGGDGFPNYAQDAHRSTKAAPAQVALQLEKMDPHTSVTFISVAHTGAKIYDPASGYDAFEQLDTVQALIGGRQIDELLVSFGGNDMEFSNLAADMVAFKFNTTGAKVVPTSNGSAAIPVGLDLTPWAQQLQTDLTDLTGNLQKLATRINQMRPQDVYFTEYPDPTLKADGTYADDTVGDILPTFSIDAGEARWAHDHLLVPLNAALQAAVAQNAANRWHYVGGIVDAFKGHNYSAGSSSFFVTASQSRDLEGPYNNWTVLSSAVLTLGGAAAGFFSLGTLAGGLGFAAKAVNYVGVAWDEAHTKGTLHPNEAGHIVIAQRILDTMRAEATDPAMTGFTYFDPATARTNVVADQTNPAGGNIWAGLSRYDPSYFEVLVNGAQVAFVPVTQLGQVMLNGGPGLDTIDVANIPAGTTVQVNGGGGRDTIEVTSLSDTSNLEAVQGRLVLDGGDSGPKSLYLYDTANSRNSIYTLTSNSLSRLGVEVGFSNFTDVHLFAGSGDDTIYARSMVSGAQLAVDGGAGDDQIFGGSGNDTLNGGAGNDVIMAGDGANDNLLGGAGNDVLVGGRGNNNLYGGDNDDVVYSNGRNDVIYGDNYDGLDDIAWGNGNDTVFVNGIASLGSVTVHGGGGNDVVNVNAVAAGESVSLYGDAGDDTINIAPAKQNLQDIQGCLHVDGGAGVDTVTVNDQAAPVANLWIGDGMVQFGALQVLYWYGVENLNVTTGAGADTVEVDALNLASTRISTGGGNDTVTVGTYTINQSLDNSNNLSIDLGSGVDSLTLNDQGDIIWRGDSNSYILDGNGLSHSHYFSGGLTYSMLYVQGAENLTLDTSSANDVVYYYGRGAGTSTRINTESGDDAVCLFPAALSAGAGTLAIDGGGGSNTLDYSYTTTGVVVNLATHTASGVAGGFAGVENVFGGSGADNLTGDAQSNILVGNDGNDVLNGVGGNDLLIGGRGSDALHGGDGDDLLIGGYTSFDHNAAALVSLLAEWNSPRDAATRFADLTAAATASAVRLNGTLYLKTSGSGQTVFDDAAADSLYGENGQDWFFVGLGDVTEALPTERRTS